MRTCKQVALREVGMAKVLVSAKPPHTIEWVSEGFSQMVKVEACICEICHLCMWLACHVQLGLGMYVCLCVCITPSRPPPPTHITHTHHFEAHNQLGPVILVEGCQQRTWWTQKKKSAPWCMYY